MNLDQRFRAFVELGNRIKLISPEELNLWISSAKSTNNWFIEENVKAAVKGLERLLDEADLQKWISAYDLSSVKSKKVGVVMAGNIPMVGFHDFLCVLMSGHFLYAKLSSQDTFLLKKVSEWLIDIEPGFSERINFVDKIKNMDAVIATGSDNTAKYFNYYFSGIPHIVRKNRISCAVLTGKETEEELALLGKDILQYFGMGCRNVAKLYVPEDYSFNMLLDTITLQRDSIDINKYFNNYDYNRTIYLLNKTKHFDNGFLLLTENENMVSPIAVLYYEKYSDEVSLQQKIETNKNKIQVIVSKGGWFPGSIPFGQTQLPGVGDYADHVDTMKFLLEI